MSDPIATYTFLPWLRQGLANNILSEDNDASVKLRASIPVELTIAATKLDGSDYGNQVIQKNIEIYGPGDIQKIILSAISKTEPRNWITNFEPNYLPYIEFYPEDFPWLHTPAKPNGNRLRPWLTLVVLREDEFTDNTNIRDKAVPSFKLKDGKKTTDIFPKTSELWAWAHVHVNKDLSSGAPPNAADDASVNTEITNLINQDPDQAYSRILSPRKLEANKGYHAFLIPTFESGRLTGLGLDLPPDLVATKCGWEDESTIEFPYYFRWYFRTGNVGDFEYLVNLLQPKPADKRVGSRDIDVLHPGQNLPTINDADLKGVLKLGGALRVPFDTLKDEDKQEILKFDTWDEHPYPHPFTEAMAKRVNLADDYVDISKNVKDVNKNADITFESSEGDPDPVITSPLYGRWQGLQKRLLRDGAGNFLPNNKNWIHELNLDPRFRVAAGLGTSVIQKNQEDYMQAAWEQVGKIVEANNKIRFAQMAKEVSAKFYSKHVLSLNTDKAFIFTAPVQKRIIYKDLTAYRQLQQSMVPPAVVTGTFRSITRPRGKTMKKLTFTAESTPFNIVNRINEGKVIIAPPRVDPTGGINLSDATGEAKPKNIPGFIEEWLNKAGWLKYLPFLLLLILIIIVLIFFRNITGSSILGGLAILLTWFFTRLNAWENEIQDAKTVSQDSQTPTAVDNYRKSPDFVLSDPGSDFNPQSGTSDSATSINFKAALKDAFSLVQIYYPGPARQKLNFTEFTGIMVQGINPSITIPKRTFDTVRIPMRILDNMNEVFVPVMVYPEIDVPMYKPLSDISSELFLPNINLIEQNSITLLENNQKFIESYMVGINHEMSRELLWREYPTDQRGTYFRQFWDVSSFLPPQPVPENIKETLRDIPPIHIWSKTNTSKADPADANSPLKNELGQHNLRALTSGKTQLVLVIRGELLKKYPTAVVYAHKADWGKKNNVQDVNEERVFVGLTDAEKQNPPTSKIKTPLFEAKVEPDIYFFGFDLDDEEARGTLNPTQLSDNPGWFFVIKERPGEPRFGLDIEKATNELNQEKIINWNNLSWKDIETPDGGCIELNKTIGFDSYDTNADQENKPNPEDIQAKWNPFTNAAELAYILYQVPVLVGVHASRMLPK